MKKDNPLEKVIERKVCKYAQDNNMLVYKFTSPARAGVPDRLFIYKGLVFFIEFKRKGKKPTDGQIRELNRLQSNNVAVFVVDEVDEGENLIAAITLFKSSNELLELSRLLSCKWTK